MVYKTIGKQIEYYLSDANLANDRFFQTQLKASKYVPLQVFLKCKKVFNLLE